MTQIRIENAAWEFIKQLEVSSEKPLLTQLEAEGVEIPNACRIGMCAACLCNIEGWDTHLNKSLKWEPAFPLWEGEIMTCIWWVTDTDELITLKTMT